MYTYYVEIDGIDVESQRPRARLYRSHTSASSAADEAASEPRDGWAGLGLGGTPNPNTLP